MNFLSIVAATSLIYWWANSNRSGFIYCDLFFGLSVLTLAGIKIYGLSNKSPLSFEKLKLLLLVPISFIPFIRHLPQIPIHGPTSFGGYDWHSYSLMAKILQARSQGRTLPIEISDPQMIEIILEKNVFGAYWPISILSTWAKIDLPLAALVTQWVAFLCLILAFFQFCRLVFGCSVNLSLFLGLVFTVNPYLHFLISEAYISQLWGMAFTFLFYISVFQIKIQPRSPILPQIYACFALVGISFMYSHMLPIVLASGLLVVVEKLSLQSMWQSLVVYLKLLFRPVTISILLTFDRQLQNLENLKNMTNISAGPGMDSQYAEAWLGLIFDPYFNKSPVVLELFLTGLFFYLMWQFVKQNHVENSKVPRWMGVGLFSGIVLMVILMNLSGLLSINYKTFKLITFFLPIFILICWVQILKNADYDRRWKVFGAILLLANIWNIGRFGMTINSMEMKTPDFSEAVQELSEGTQRVILIAERSERYSSRDYEMMFAGVAFADHQLSFWNSFGVFSKGPIVGDWAYVSGFSSRDGFDHFDLQSRQVCLYRLQKRLFKKTNCRIFSEVPSQDTITRTNPQGEIIDVIAWSSSNF